MRINPLKATLRRPARHGDGGFTLLEVIVGLTIVLIVTASLVPLLVTGAAASQAAKLSTEAKNLTTERLDSMRSLQFHVAAQNGPFVDVLDEYFVNSSATSVSIPTTGGTGSYVSSGVVPGESAASAFYKVSFSSSSSPNPLPSGFTQDVYTQFLAPNTTSGSAPTGDTVITPPSNYNNDNPTSTQTDSPSSNLIGVTVVTYYTLRGGTHHYEVFTEIADTGHDQPLVVAEAGTQALQVSSTAYDGTGLTAVYGAIGENATLSNESSAYDSVQTATFTRLDPLGATTYPTISGAQGNWTAPPAATSGQSGSQSVECAAPSSTSTSCGTTNNCGWAWAGPTSYSDVGATVSSAQPRVPQDVESSGSTQLTFPNSGVGATCGGLGVTNVLNGSPAVNPALVGFSSGNPIVEMNGGPASTSVLSGTAKIDTPKLTFASGGGSSSPVTSSASLTYAEPIYLFPGLSSFVTAGALPDGSASNNALVAIEFSSAVSISCNAQQADATAAYAGTIYVWEQPSKTGSGAYTAIPFSFNSGTPTTLPSPGSITVTWSGGTAVPLSNYLLSWGTGNIVQQQPADAATNTSVGIHTIPEAISIVTQPTLSDGLSDGGVNNATNVIANIGTVSCASEDNRT